MFYPLLHFGFPGRVPHSCQAGVPAFPHPEAIPHEGLPTGISTKAQHGQMEATDPRWRREDRIRLANKQ